MRHWLWGVWIAAVLVAGCGKDEKKQAREPTEGEKNRAAAEAKLKEIFGKRDEIREGWAKVVEANDDVEAATAFGAKYVEEHKAEMEALGKRLAELKNGDDAAKAVFREAMMNDPGTKAWYARLKALTTKHGPKGGKLSSQAFDLNAGINKAIVNK